MPFNSVEYFLFLWAAVLVFYAVPAAYKKITLLFFCYAFYAFWSVPYTLFLMSATFAVYFLAFRLRASGRGLYLMAAMALLLGSFIFFKGLPLWRQPFSVLSHIAVPAGFSYYTFRLMSYILDISRGHAEPEKDPVLFACYAAFFPHILSGPIQRAEEFFPQSAGLGRQDPALWASGLRLILIGLFKKLVIADNLAVVVENVFGHSTMYGTSALWIASYVFYLQLYADFSGLTDIAIGSGRLFGIDAPPNFNAPYLARSVQDFWRRWHMTLCRWINDYLFAPLQLSLRRWPTAGLLTGLFISMLAISLWHGLSTGFLAFGMIQGVLIGVSAMTMRKRDRFFKGKEGLNALRRIAAPLVTFHLMVFSFIFFRCPSFTEGLDFFLRLFQGPFHFGGLGLGMGRAALFFSVAGLVLIEWFERIQTTERAGAFLRRPLALRWGAYYAVLTGVLFFGRFWPKEFIYFKF